MCIYRVIRNKVSILLNKNYNFSIIRVIIDNKVLQITNISQIT